MTDYTNDLYLGWDEFQKHSIALAEKLAKSGEQFDALIAVTRGGLFPAGLIARELDIHLVDTICISRYTHQSTQQTEVVLKIPKDYADKKILVVDDLADKGRTLALVKAHLPHAVVATVFVKPEGKPLVDYYVQETAQDTWVRFPWDTYRMYKTPLVQKPVE